MVRRKAVTKCETCLQPATIEYQFTLTYYEAGKKIVKTFCGASCLKSWIETELDKIHLMELYDLKKLAK